MTPFVPPPYPYDRLDGMIEQAAAHPGGAVDLSIGTPNDPPPPAVVAALGGSGTERGDPPSVGRPELREAAARFLQRRLGVDVDPAHVAATIGSKEFVAGTPHWLRLRCPDRDTVLYPQVSYPTYAMGATLAGCRAVAVPVDPEDGLDVAAIDPSDAARALCLWSNSPANPAGTLDDLGAIADWGRRNGVPVLSDECYVEYTWEGGYRTVLEHGSEGVLALHSLSKRSNMAGVRVGFYAGDPDLVHYLSEVRKHAGFMCPGPAQAAGIAALDDDEHVEQQRARYRGRLDRLRAILASALGLDIPMPAGGFYLWAAAPDGDCWSLTERLAKEAGMVVSPGEFYGEAGSGHVRIASVCPDEALDLVAARRRRMTDLLALAVELVEIPSESFHERELANRLEVELRGCAWLDVHRIGDNVVARTEQDRPHRLALAGHTDTVPANGNVHAVTEGDVLHGLGACDMKGSLAAMLDVARTVSEPAIDVTYVFYACEEVALQHNGLRGLFDVAPELLVADCALLGEPTSTAVEAGCQGTMRARVTMRGERAHTARPWMGTNAIHRLGPVLDRLGGYEGRRPLIDGCEYREAMQAVAVEGGVAGNVVPDEAVLVVNHRFAPDRTAEEAAAHLAAVLGPVDRFEVTEVAPGAPPSLGHPLLRALIDRNRLPVRAKLGWTDVAFFAERGIAAANFGAGDPTLAHTAGEYVTRAEIEAVRAVLADLITIGVG